jgi:hypothetical protein
MATFIIIIMPRLGIIIEVSVIHWSLDDDSVDVSGTTDSKG